MRLRIFSLSCILIIAGLVAACQIPPGNTYTLTVKIKGQGRVYPEKGKMAYAKNSVAHLQAEPSLGWQFSHWEGAVAQRDARETTVFVDNPKTITAVFVKNELIILPAPGGPIASRKDGTTPALRPRGSQDIEYIMLHAISDAAANPQDPFEMKRIRAIFDDYSVESHYVIDRQGGIYQFMDDERIARHAGQGSWAAHPKYTDNMNRYSLGIELLGIGTEEEMESMIGPGANSLIKPAQRGYTQAQYRALKELVQHLQSEYNLSPANLLGHGDYDPQRRWDPGSLFRWEDLRF